MSHACPHGLIMGRCPRCTLRGATDTEATIRWLEAAALEGRNVDPGANDDRAAEIESAAAVLLAVLVPSRGESCPHEGVPCRLCGTLL